MASMYDRYGHDEGVFKDIVDELYYVRKYDSPLQDMASNIKATDRIHYWTSKVYATVSSNTTARAESATLTTGSAPTVTEYGNMIEENAVPYDVSTIKAQIAKSKGLAGITDMVAEARKDALVALKDNLEFSLLRGVVASGDATSTAYKMKGLISLASAYGVTASASAISASGAEDEFVAGLASTNAAGGLRGRNKVLLTSYTAIEEIGSNWKGNATAVNTMTEDAKIYKDVKIYVSVFGPLTIRGHQMAEATKIVVFDSSELKIAWLYNTRDIELGRTKLVEGYAAVANACTLQYDNPSTLYLFTIS